MSEVKKALLAVASGLMSGLVLVLVLSRVLA
jgi:hypothetical protein